MKNARLLALGSLWCALVAATSGAVGANRLPNIVVIIPDAKPELYDLQRDPWEKTDLAAQQPERVLQLKQKLDAWWTPPVTAK